MFHLPRSVHRLIMYNLIVKRYVAQIFEIKQILYLYDSLLQINCLGSHRCNHLLVMQKPCGRSSVRTQQAVHAEIRVVRLIPEIAAIPPGCPAFFVFLLNPMIIPFPDEAALEPAVLPEQPLILFQISRPVSHGMTVLAENVRLSVAVVPLPDLRKPLKPGIHRRIHVRNICRRISLIVNQTGSVQFPYRLRRCVKILSHRRFISKGPHQNRGVVPVLLHHSYRPVNVCFPEAFLIVQPFVSLYPFKPVRFQICFINHIKTVLVAQVIKVRHLRIVRTSDGIDVVTLHHPQMFFHRIPAHNRAAGRAEIMHINTIEQNRHAIHKKIGSPDFYSSESSGNFCLIQQICQPLFSV